MIACDVTRQLLQYLSSSCPICGGVSERVHREMNKYGVTTALRPHTTLRRLLVHPEDKEELAEQGELVDQIPCKNCGAEYIGDIPQGRRQHEQ